MENAFHKRFEVDPTGKIMVLDKFCPWESHLNDLEDENAESKGVTTYIIFPDSVRGYRVRSIPQSIGSFQSRKKLPTPWLALRDDELSKVCGVPGCVFVHAGGFIGGNDTLDGALQMAKLAIAFKDSA